MSGVQVLRLVRQVVGVRSPTTPSKSSEQLLVDRIREGDPNALGQAYDAHHTAVRAFAQRLIGSQDEAEDLVHETFVSLAKALRNFRGDCSLRTFLISIAINHARHFVRAAARRRSALQRWAELPPGQENPVNLFERKDLAKALTQALDSLPWEQRLAFVLCEVEERSSKEAAELMNVPEATARTRLFHAKRKLRDWLEKEGFQ
jgi:RNA polymerase sigma-70 factor, ECF subfamily